jgi:formylglycine-generating enzyme required for sulfatase activity
MANTTEAGINDRSTAVGIYPHGRTANGVLDLAGNLWEWCINDYNSLRVSLSSNGNKSLKGGSFYNDYQSAHTAYRINRSPSIKSIHYGIRVIVAPFLANFYTDALGMLFAKRTRPLA